MVRAHAGGAPSKRSMELVVLAVGALLVLSTLPASATVRYSDRGRDGNDVSTSIDIRSTTRKVVDDKHGRAVKISMRGWQPFPAYPQGGIGYLKLDTRGGPFADVRMSIRVGVDQSCLIAGQSISYDVWWVDGPANWFACKVPFSALRQAGAKPNKQIRWKLQLTHNDGGPTDHAPDHGWYT